MAQKKSAVEWGIRGSRDCRLAQDGNHAPLIPLVIEDLAPGKYATGELRTSEIRYRRLFEAAKDGILILDPSSRQITDSNPFMTELLGYSRKELLGKELWEIGLLKDEEASRAAFQELKEKGVIRYEDLPLETTTGERREVEFVSNVYQEDGEEVIQCNIRDITERKRTAEALREAGERFRFLAESMPQKIFTAKLNGEVDYFNRQWTEFTGLPFEQIKGWGWAQLIHPDDVDENVRLWQLSIDTAEPFQFEHRFRRADGEYRWHLSRARAMRDPAGRVLMWIGSNTDIDDMKRAGDEKERLLKSEHEARQEAETANRAKDEFLATVSHELRTPLNAILGWADLLVRGKLDEKTAARGLAIIARNARAQNQLISDLLEVSRIITGQLRFEAGVVDLIPVIDAAADTVRPAAQAKGVELWFMLDPGAGMVSGDAARLQQIVWNLLTNAVKFTSRNGRVDVQLKRDDTSVVIIVSDTGEGISPEFLPYIFDRFRQAEGTTTRQHGGLGLGLAIVRHLVEAHGGTVRAASQGVGEGATFTVTLPLIAVKSDEGGGMKDEEDFVNQSAALGPQPLLVGLRVLVVDDEPDARELLTIVLKERGAEVRASTTAREALAMLKQWKPDVLVSDIGMPGEDGYALIRNVRTLKSASGGLIPALALTGYAAPEDAARALESGYHMHLPKPVAPGELVTAVASLAMKTLQV